MLHSSYCWLLILIELLVMHNASRVTTDEWDTRKTSVLLSPSALLVLLSTFYSTVVSGARCFLIPCYAPLRPRLYDVNNRLPQDRNDRISRFLQRRVLVILMVRCYHATRLYGRVFMMSIIDSTTRQMMKSRDFYSCLLYTSPSPRD